MKISEVLGILLLLGMGYWIIHKEFNPSIIESIDTLYVTGETTHDTLYQDSIVYVDKWRTRLDTLYVDSSGTHAKADFSFGEDSVQVKGKVYFDEPMFSFSHLQVKYPYKIINTKQVDTLKLTEHILIKGFSHGPQAGIGYGIINKEFDIYVGYGFQFNF